MWFSSVPCSSISRTCGKLDELSPSARILNLQSGKTHAAKEVFFNKDVNQWRRREEINLKCGPLTDKQFGILVWIWDFIPTFLKESLTEYYCCGEESLEVVFMNFILDIFIGGGGNIQDDFSYMEASSEIILSMPMFWTSIAAKFDMNLNVERGRGNGLPHRGNGLWLYDAQLWLVIQRVIQLTWLELDSSLWLNFTILKNYYRNVQCFNPQAVL